MWYDVPSRIFSRKIIDFFFFFFAIASFRHNMKWAPKALCVAIINSLFGPPTKKKKPQQQQQQKIKQKTTKQYKETKKKTCFNG